MSNISSTQKRIDSAVLMCSIAGVQKEIHLKLILSHTHRFVRKRNRSEHEAKSALLDIEVARLRVVKQEMLLELSKNQLNDLINGQGSGVPALLQ